MEVLLLSPFAEACGFFVVDFSPCRVRALIPENFPVWLSN